MPNKPPHQNENSSSPGERDLYASAARGSSRADAVASNAGGATGPGEASGGEPGAAEAASGPRLRLRVDDRNLHANYANAFRTNATAEEVILDFGLDMLVSAPNQGAGRMEGEALFQVTDRVIMGYPTLKRLAIALGRLVREHESRVGEIEVDSRPSSKAG